MNFQTYLAQIGANLQAGNATEHSHRPALQALIESVESDLRATNEPKRIRCGAPDFVVARKLSSSESQPVGYIEAKDVGKSLDENEGSEQMARYLESLENLVLTDYLEFRLYRSGEKIETARLARVAPNGKLKIEDGGAEKVAALLQSFADAQPVAIGSARELAQRMARLARLMRDAIRAAFDEEQPENKNTPDPLHDQLEAFRRVLLHDLQADEFADMYAQTICYGLFTARTNHKGGPFSRRAAPYDLPKTNPFLREMFEMLAGLSLEEQPFVWVVDDLAALLQCADMTSVLEDFGNQTGQADPVVHFYETFLAAYDPKLRETRGVYYTPEPVVSYIVRSVDKVLKRDFGVPQGLADATKLPESEHHKVLILDPAAGTGTFLHGVVAHIAESFKGNKGMWSGYVQKHLLPRLFGFELMVAPYAVAHMKLGLQLEQSGYDLDSGERINVFLTNTLEAAARVSGSIFAQKIAAEANAAVAVKNELPILVVLGNPPYSGHSANENEWIHNLLRGASGLAPSYFEVDGAPLGERNPKWLNDDYVKFLRFSQWRIAQTGYGVLAFITNHGYLDNPTFRGMRQSLMTTFDEIYVLDLHGNERKKERAPDGGKDQNVFDIQQGVAIGIFVKHPPDGNEKTPAVVRHAHLWGARDEKYAWLSESDAASTPWKELQPQTPFYLFVPQDVELREEYSAAWKITDVMAVNVLGFQTHRDKFAIAFEEETIETRIADLRGEKASDDELRQKYDLTDNRDWQLSAARRELRKNDDWKNHVIRCLYRPFDWRWCYFGTAAMDYPRRELQENVENKSNLCFNIVRQTKSAEWRHALVSDNPTPAVFVEIKDGSSIFPLYLYPSDTKSTLFESEPTTAPGGRRANLSTEFIAALSSRWKLQWIEDGRGDLASTFGPEDVFHYCYAIFHAPSYRVRYADFLKIDFPRVPLTSNGVLWRALCEAGRALTALHLLESDLAPQVSFPIEGDDIVDKVKFQPIQNPKSKIQNGKVFINGAQYFEGVPSEVWEFHIGGYRVAEKWLKDRKGRRLDYDDLTHYGRVIAALGETRRVMSEIDEAIEANGGWPLE